MAVFEALWCAGRLISPSALQRSRWSRETAGWLHNSLACLAGLPHSLPQHDTARDPFFFFTAATMTALWPRLATTPAHSHRHRHTHTHRHTRIRTHTLTHTHTHTVTHTRTHRVTHTQTQCTHTHTHTDKHTQLYARHRSAWLLALPSSSTSSLKAFFLWTSKVQSKI